MSACELVPVRAALKLPKFVQTEKSRHGRLMYFYRRGMGRRIRLPDLDHPDFLKAWKIAHEHDLSIYVPTPKPATFEEKQIQAVGQRMTDAVRAARTRARTKCVPFDLDVAWALDQARAQGFKCALTGIPFFLENEVKSKVNPYSPSFDRIVPKLGYTRENVRIVLWAVNVMLMDWGEDTFSKIANGYRKHKGEKTRQLAPPLYKRFGVEIPKSR